jgi:hypothetical protein
MMMMRHNVYAFVLLFGQLNFTGQRLSHYRVRSTNELNSLFGTGNRFARTWTNKQTSKCNVTIGCEIANEHADMTVSNSHLKASIVFGCFANWVTTDWMYETEIVLNADYHYIVWNKIVCRYMFLLQWYVYQSPFIPVGVAEASQISLRDAHFLPKLFSHN